MFVCVHTHEREFVTSSGLYEYAAIDFVHLVDLGIRFCGFIQNFFKGALQSLPTLQAVTLPYHPRTWKMWEKKRH